MKTILSTTVTMLAMLSLAACSDPAAPAETEAPGEPMTDAAVAELASDRDLMMDGLAGSFRDAGPDSPALLIVPGSGPTDRNGNSPLGISANSYRMLAEGLQSAGLSSLRVDKRGMFGSEGAGDGNAVSVDLYAQDYLNWAARLREETERDCVYLLGHSEGGLMVSAAAAQNPEGICGLILVAAPGRSLGDVLREQLRSNPANAPILDQALGAIDSLEAGERVDADALHPAIRPLFADALQGFLISVMAVDPTGLVREADLPTLLLQGDRDLQVAMTDARALEAAGGTLVVLEGVNHALKPAPEDRAGNFATYADPDLPLDPAIVLAIADFIEKTRP